MKKSLKSLTWAGALALAFVSFPVQAAPAISGVTGTVSPGATLQITGSGFGTKPTAAPMLWDDFENGAVGAAIENVAARVGRWDSNDGTKFVTYSNRSPYAGSKSSSHDFVSWWGTSLAKNVTFSRLYMDFWVRAKLTDIKSHNWKVWRLYGNNDNLQLNSVYYCNSQAVSVVDVGSIGQNYWQGETYNDGEWLHVQLLYQESTPGGQDGTVIHTVNSKVLGIASSSVPTRTVNASMNQIRIGHYWGTEGLAGACAPSAPAQVYVDNVYLDTSWARVEIGNAGTYAQSTVREVQVPSRWSDGSVEIAANLGRFAAGQKVYLYVFDANNQSVVNGFELTVGSNSSAALVSNPKPAAPSGISVQ
jgi:hypothetical protein